MYPAEDFVADMSCRNVRSAKGAVKRAAVRPIVNIYPPDVARNVVK